MSKRITTRWYISAWVVWIAAFMIFLGTADVHRTAAGFFAFATTPLPMAMWFVMTVAAIAMLVTWIGALVAVGQAHAWGWFVAVLVLQLLGLGIFGMILYTLAGPGDVELQHPVRPSFT
jgi:hypothetical protein